MQVLFDDNQFKLRTDILIVINKSYSLKLNVVEELYYLYLYQQLLYLFLHIIFWLCYISYRCFFLFLYADTRGAESIAKIKNSLNGEKIFPIDSKENFPERPVAHAGRSCTSG